MNQERQRKLKARATRQASFEARYGVKAAVQAPEPPKKVIVKVESATAKQKTGADGNSKQSLNKQLNGVVSTTKPKPRAKE
jgi:hypothetical protein